jgi:hypothetical protein
VSNSQLSRRATSFTAPSAFVDARAANRRLPQSVGDAADGEATVRVEDGGAGAPRIMRFESGTWVMEPTQGFAAHLGKSVAQIVAEEKAAGLCF